MINDIRAHIDSNDDLQSAIEQDCAPQMARLFQSNIAAFKRHMPQLAEQLARPYVSQFAVFVNKHKDFNIVDYGTGKTLYGLRPQQQIAEQIDNLAQQSVVVEIHGKSIFPKPADGDNLKQRLAVREAALSTPSDVLVILGVGLGSFILPLLKRRSPKHVLIYEPEFAFLKCSITTTDWSAIFNFCTEHDIHLYIQSEQDGAQLFSDLKELATHFPIQRTMIYRHYHHHRFVQIQKLAEQYSMDELCQTDMHEARKDTIFNYYPLMTPSVDLANYQPCEISNAHFQRNMLAVQQAYPDLHARLLNYQCQYWQAIQDADGQVNLLHKQALVTWYSDTPKQDAKLNLDNFIAHPNRDGLILSYKGDKNKHFLHNVFVAETQDLLKEAENVEGELPKENKAIVIFGLGAGYEFEALVSSRKIEHIFLCEPSLDAFYASLFTVDWVAIFAKIEDDDSHLYLNIGDDGRYLLNDLMAQFYRIGPYILNETFFFQTYENDFLHAVTSDLREQLRLTVTMSEHFDHALYGVQQTILGIQNTLPVFANAAHQYINDESAHVPVFLIGNGPSLDASIDSIKTYQSQAIIISCGTALQALYKHGIKPDYHCEIEQYRSTFDWAMRINAPHYLKDITLLSCNGIHPDTVELYKDCYVAFKQGEASTRLVADLIGEEQFSYLEHAYPTVSNFALNLFLAAGFKQLYLFGIDLGFVDPNRHHSSASGYYNQDGTELFNYQQAHNTGLVVAGNFHETVQTKLEFNISRATMEKCIREFNADIYNTAQGARIAGTVPLEDDDILVLSSAESKQQALKAFLNTFISIDGAAFAETLNHKLSNDELLAAIDKLRQLSDECVQNELSIRELIDQHRSHLHAQYVAADSMFFYYFHGSINYLNAVLTKIALMKDEQRQTELKQEITQHWRNMLDNVKSLLTRQLALTDTCASFTPEREVMMMRQAAEKPRLNFIAEHSEHQQALLAAIDDFDITPIKRSEQWHTDAINIVFLARLNSSTLHELLQQLESMPNTCKLMLVVNFEYCAADIEWQIVAQNKRVSVLLSAIDAQTRVANAYDIGAGGLPYLPVYRLLQNIAKHSRDIASTFLFVPKLEFSEDQPAAAKAYIEQCVVPTLPSTCFHEFKHYLGFSRKMAEEWDSATFEDQLRSRGMLYTTAVKHYHLTGVWRTATNIRKMQLPAG